MRSETLLTEKTRPPGQALLLDRSRTLACLALLLHCLPAAAAPADALPSDAILESQHAVIGEIYVDNSNIFDPSIPGEDRLLYRMANTLHIRTRPQIILRQLLFKSGDPYDPRLLEESERILRSNDYLRDAIIVPVHYADGKVDISVRTVDVWTLDPRLSIGRSGGTNRSSFGVKESNLFGTGIHFGLFRKSNVDREGTQVDLFDRELGSTRYALNLSYADNSDGYRALLDFNRPFFALDSNRSDGISLLSGNQVDSLYDLGEIQDQFQHQYQDYQIYAGRSDGLEDGWARRHSLGLAYQDDRFEPYAAGSWPSDQVPQDRKFVYPFYEWELIEDHFEEAQNHDQIGTTEDRYLGTRLNLRVGYASTAFGSLNDALILNSDASVGFGSSEASSLITTGALHARVEDGSLNDTLLTVRSIFHHRQSEHLLFHLALTGNLGKNLDLDHPLMLGGDNGLRGYPLRYQGGDASALVTLEERLFTDWYPFRLFRIGAVAFVDAGRTWGVNPVGGESLGWLRDVGFGFRFGNTRSGIGRVVHLDFAFPLDGDSDIDSMQILVEGHATF